MKSFIDDRILQTEEAQTNTESNIINYHQIELNNEESNVLCSSSSSNFCVPPMSESPPLKRTHAIPDLHSMDDYSPVTFETSLSIKSDDVEDSPKFDLIEETKEVINGIKVRASKLPNLIETLVDSFGKIVLLSKFQVSIYFQFKIKDESGDLLQGTDFPRVFFLMHKWFMESEDLVSMLSELYLKYEINQNEHSIGSQLRICHAFRLELILPFFCCYN